MSTKYLIKKVETCLVCNGRKVVQHPAWEEYWEEHINPLTTTREDAQWFADHGWCDDWYDIPYEETYCSECDGEGEIVSEVNLLTILKDLL